MKSGAKKAIIAGGIGIAAISTAVVAQKRKSTHDSWHTDNAMPGFDGAGTKGYDPMRNAESNVANPWKASDLPNE